MERTYGFGHGVDQIHSAISRINLNCINGSPPMKSITTPSYSSAVANSRFTMSLARSIGMVFLDLKVS